MSCSRQVKGQWGGGYKATIQGGLGRSLPLCWAKRGLLGVTQYRGVEFFSGPELRCCRPPHVQVFI